MSTTVASALGPTLRPRRIEAEEVEAYRDIRLRALRQDRRAFGSTLERESAYGPAQWQSRVTASATSDRETIWVLGPRGGPFFGLAGAFRDGDRFMVVGMWLEPSYRGAGHGGALLDAVLAWIRTVAPSAPIVLSVNPEQAAAERLYRSRGFVPTGRTEPLPHAPDARIVELTLPHTDPP